MFQALTETALGSLNEYLSMFLRQIKQVILNISRDTHCFPFPINTEPQFSNIRGRGSLKTLWKSKKMRVINIFLQSFLLHGRQITFNLSQAKILLSDEDFW